MHSKLRLKQFYPNMSEQDLQAFYGHFLALEEMTKPEWKRFVDNGELLRTNITARWPGWVELNQINLAEFYRKSGFRKNRWIQDKNVLLVPKTVLSNIRSNKRSF